MGRVIRRAQVIEFAGFWSLDGDFLANSILSDSLESQAVILLARADGSGGFAMRPPSRTGFSERTGPGRADLHHGQSECSGAGYITADLLETNSHESTCRPGAGHTFGTHSR